MPTVRPPEWYTPKIDRKTMKSLMKRHNYRAFISHGLWFALLGGIGYIAARVYPSPWCILIFFAYGTIYSTCNARWHESLHGTPFRTRFLNDIVFFIAATMEHRDIVLARWSHMKHHSYTIIRDVDIEIVASEPLRIWKLWIDFINLKNIFILVPVMVLHSLGIPSGLAKKAVLKSEYKKMFWAARACLFVHLASIALAIVLQSWLPVLLFTLPRLYGGTLIWLFVIAQHTGLAENVHDHRLSTRTMYLNPFFSFLYMHMEYHIEHHMFPAVPFHALARLHDVIKPYLPRTYTGLWDVYRELVPALLRQRRDPTSYIKRELPAAG